MSFASIASGLSGLSGGLTSTQQGILNLIKDPEKRALAQAQALMDNLKEIIQAVTNMMKSMHETAQSIVTNYK